jgi:hypothetical protein
MANEKTRTAPRAALSVDSPDMTPAEVAAFRRESETTVWRKCRSGVYVSYRSGRDKRLIVRESVIADRDKCLVDGLGFAAPAEGKRGRGYPKGRKRKAKADAAPAGG